MIGVASLEQYGLLGVGIAAALYLLRTMISKGYRVRLDIGPVRKDKS